VTRRGRQSGCASPSSGERRKTPQSLGREANLGGGIFVALALALTVRGRRRG